MHKEVSQQLTYCENNGMICLIIYDLIEKCRGFINSVKVLFVLKSKTL